ncbi:MAG TPA: alpha/beta hydrolase [Marmoricola sp.]|jgi:alpha-beta hydrolase superfamily lysophospholipase|nr:alpha/beta hydrolase [Marmoricola sp.]
MSDDFSLQGHAGALHARHWRPGEPTWVALLCHGYGEHLGRYEWLADRLTADGAAAYALDHVGHGRSEGERVLVHDFERVVEDFHLLAEHARAAHPGLPLVLIGHSMGGMIAARYGQRYGDELTCVVLSGPVVGRWDAVEALLALDEIPDVPIDPATLSRDESVGATYAADPLVWHGPFKRPTLEALARTIDDINEGGALPVPVMWLHGADDQLVPYEGSAAGWPRIAGDHSDQVAFDGARHEIFNETNKDEVVDTLLGFVHRHLPATA